MSTYTWLIIAAVLLCIEMLTGTFYLLVLAIAAVVTWLAYLLNAPLLAQALIFCVVSAALLPVAHRYRKARQTRPNAAQNLDAGEVVMVEWRDNIGSTRYRGAPWQVVSEYPNDPQVNGAHQIVRLDSSRIVVRPISNI